MRTELKILRIKHNLTQTDIAQKLGISRSTYNLVEQGKRNGSKKFWLAVQNLFELGDAEVWKLQK